MAAAIDATVGGASANSYATAAEFATYADERSVATAHTDATTDERIRALITAARELDRQRWHGVKTAATQALQWPRYSVVDPDLSYSTLTGAMFRESVWIDSATIPDRVKRAQMELAYLILAGTYTTDPNGLGGFETVKVGALEVTPRHQQAEGALPDVVRREIGPFLQTGGNSVRVVRG